MFIVIVLVLIGEFFIGIVLSEIIGIPGMLLFDWANRNQVLPDL